MATAIEAAGPDIGPTKVWTLIVRGGAAFIASHPGNPVLRHNGEQTLCKLAATAREVERFAAYIRHECGGQVELFSDEQSVEQSLIRLAETGQPGPR